MREPIMQSQQDTGNNKYSVYKYTYISVFPLFCPDIVLVQLCTNSQLYELTDSSLKHYFYNGSNIFLTLSDASWDTMCPPNLRVDISSLLAIQ
jgi:hypothetical protein